jgi:hypothetical protein
MHTYRLSREKYKRLAKKSENVKQKLNLCSKEIENQKFKNYEINYNNNSVSLHISTHGPGRSSNLTDSCRGAGKERRTSKFTL